MTKCTVGGPVTTDTPAVEVDAGLPPGRHKWTLVVEDNDGVRSEPATVVVVVSSGR